MMSRMVLPPIGLRLARTARTVSQAFERAMAEAGGAASMWQVLLLVRTQQWGNQSQMADAMGITGATLTHHLNAMEKQGLVRRWREESNRRGQRGELAAGGEAMVERPRRAAGGRAAGAGGGVRDGEAMFERLRGAAVAHDARLRDGFSEDELAQLAGLLDRLKASVESGPVPVHEHAVQRGADAD